MPERPVWMTLDAGIRRSRCTSTQVARTCPAVRRHHYPSRAAPSGNRAAPPGDRQNPPALRVAVTERSGDTCPHSPRTTVAVDLHHYPTRATPPAHHAAPPASHAAPPASRANPPAHRAAPLPNSPHTPVAPFCRRALLYISSPTPKRDDDDFPLARPNPLPHHLGASAGAGSRVSARSLHPFRLPGKTFRHPLWGFVTR